MEAYYSHPPTTAMKKPCKVLAMTIDGTRFAIASDGAYIVSARCWLSGKNLGNAVDGPPNKKELMLLMKAVEKLPPPCQRLCCAGSVIV